MSNSRVTSTRRRFSACVAVLALISGACAGGQAATIATRTVVTREMSFRPTYLRVAAGKPTVIVVVNNGELAHTFSLNELGLEKKVPPGQQRRLTVDVPAGEYAYVCRILDHEGLGMSGRLVVA